MGAQVLSTRIVSRGYAHEILEVVWRDITTGEVVKPATSTEAEWFFNNHPEVRIFGSWLCRGSNKIHFCID